MFTEIRLRSFYILFAVVLGGLLCSPVTASELGASGDVTPNLDPSSWTGATIVNIGRDEAGSAWAYNGNMFASGETLLGAYSGPAGPGTVTINGVGSTWSCDSSIYAGAWGTGTLNVQDGGAVYADSLTIGAGYTSTGSTVTVDSGTLESTTGLYAQTSIVVGDAGEGSLAVTGNNASVNGATITIGLQDGGLGDADITSGGSCNFTTMEIGKDTGSTGTVSVSGSGTIFGSETSSLYVGINGSGTFNVNGGSTVGLNNLTVGQNGTLNVGNSDFSASGTTTINSGDLLFEGGGTATFDTLKMQYGLNMGGPIIKDKLWFFGSWGMHDMNVRCGEGFVGNGDTFTLGESEGSYSKVIVGNGGSFQLNSLNVGGLGYADFNFDKLSSLNVTGDTSINSQSRLNVSLSADGSKITFGSNVINNGVIGFDAGTLEAGTYSAMTIGGTYSGSGTVETYGGKWNPSTYEVIVADALQVVDGQKAEFDLATIQRVEISQECIVNFQGTATSTPVGLTTTLLSDTVRNELDALLEADESILNGRTFEIDEDTYGDRSIGLLIETADLDNLKFWRKSDGDAWVEFQLVHVMEFGMTPDQYMAYTITTGFSSYAVTGTAIPEPTTLALLAAGAVMFIRRKK